MNLNTHRSTKLASMAAMTLALGLGTGPAAAVTADDVACDRCVDTSDIAPGAVTAAKMLDGSVTNSKLSQGAVVTNNIQNNAVTSAKIADGSINAGKISQGAIETAKIKSGAVTAGKIADGAVLDSKIADAAITSSKLASGAVTSGKIANGAVNFAKLDPQLQGSLSLLTPFDATAVDSSATHQEYDVISNISFRNGNCVSPDYEIRDITRTVVATDIEHVVIDRQRQVGGSTCDYQTLYFIKNLEGTHFYKRELRNNAGTTVSATDEMSDCATELFSDPTSDCGFTSSTSAMFPGLPVVSAEGIERDGVLDGAGMQTVTLTDYGFDEVVPAGSFDNCYTILMQRMSHRFGEDLMRVTTSCAGAGNVESFEQRDDNTFYYRELVNVVLP